MANEQTSAIVSKVWGLCNPLRDDGVSYGDYLEQLTYLIFLKMSDEYSHPPTLYSSHSRYFHTHHQRHYKMPSVRLCDQTVSDPNPPAEWIGM